jgi:hypothetical protein
MCLAVAVSGAKSYEWNSMVVGAKCAGAGPPAASSADLAGKRTVCCP